MMIKGENTIPSGRQYENFKMSYEIEIVDDDIKALNEARSLIHHYLIEDANDLHNKLMFTEEQKSKWIEKKDGTMEFKSKYDKGEA